MAPYDTHVLVEFLAYRSPHRVDKAVHAEFFATRCKDAGVIAKNAVPGSLCEEAMTIYAACYGAEVRSKLWRHCEGWIDV